MDKVPAVKSLYNLTLENIVKHKTDYSILPRVIQRDIIEYKNTPRECEMCGDSFIVDYEGYNIDGKRFVFPTICEFCFLDMEGAPEMYLYGETIVPKDIKICQRCEKPYSVAPKTKVRGDEITLVSHKFCEDCFWSGLGFNSSSSQQESMS